MSTSDDPTEARATLTFRGVPIAVDLLALDADQLAAIEKRVERLLARDGWNAPDGAQPSSTATPAGASSPPACPSHGTAKVRMGKRGYFCAAKLPSGEYCSEKPI